ncbi:protein kinase domain-containing protein [Streptomyces roseicoloratus]|uniref:protein kinase domain-containing protein n=1 Tax=Streptomyces roseicoloratus TaxID=2508722 RepID=UPI0035A5ADD5
MGREAVPRHGTGGGRQPRRRPGRSVVLGAEQVATVAAHAAAGLAAAHRQGVVHRDIKPGNLLMDADGTVKLADFGIARFVDDPSAGLTTTGQIVGTGLYLAPERALGQPASPASDVYSLGCVLYQLLTGQTPFRADTATALLYQHIDTPPAPPRQLGVPMPAAFEAYLLSLLAKQPEQRPTAQAIADWFSSGAWRDQPMPLPQAVPSQPAPHGMPPGSTPQGAPRTPPHGVPPRAVPQHQATPPHQAAPLHQAAAAHQGAPHSVRPTAPHPAVAPGGAAGPNAVPGPVHGGPVAHAPVAHAPVAHAPQQRSRRVQPQPAENPLAAISRRRPRRTAAVAGAVAFVVFLLIGMAWLS